MGHFFPLQVIFFPDSTSDSALGLWCLKPNADCVPLPRAKALTTAIHHRKLGWAGLGTQPSFFKNKEFLETHNNLAQTSHLLQQVLTELHSDHKQA